MLCRFVCWLAWLMLFTFLDALSVSAHLLLRMCVCGAACRPWLHVNITLGNTNSIIRTLKRCMCKMYHMYAFCRCIWKSLGYCENLILRIGASMVTMLYFSFYRSSSNASSTYHTLLAMFYLQSHFAPFFSLSFILTLSLCHFFFSLKQFMNTMIHEYTIYITKS